MKGKHRKWLLSDDTGAWRVKPMSTTIGRNAVELTSAKTSGHET
jgi:hypothetical protein